MFTNWGVLLQLRVHRRPSTLVLSTVCANAEHTSAEASSTITETCGTISIVLETELVIYVWGYMAHQDRQDMNQIPFCASYWSRSVC